MVRSTPFYIRLLCGLLVPKVRIPGAEVAGKVVAAGRNVVKFKPGDEVHGDISECGFGGWAEYVCAPESALALKPAAMTFAEAAALPHAARLTIHGLRDYGQAAGRADAVDQWCRRRGRYLRSTNCPVGATRFLSGRHLKSLLALVVPFHPEVPAIRPSGVCSLPRPCPACRRLSAVPRRRPTPKSSFV